MNWIMSNFVRLARRIDEFSDYSKNHFISFDDLIILRKLLLWSAKKIIKAQEWNEKIFVKFIINIQQHIIWNTIYME
jgi:hypothetical protein